MCKKHSRFKNSAYHHVVSLCTWSKLAGWQTSLGLGLHVCLYLVSHLECSNSTAEKMILCGTG